MKYTFNNLVNNKKTRDDFFRDYDKLIKFLRRDGYNSVALKHAKKKKEIAEAIALLD